MIITALNKEKKHLTRISLDDENELLIDNDVCSEKGLKCGVYLDDEDISALKHESDYRRAKSRALWYLDRMDYTEKGLYQKLVKAGFGSRASAEVMARFVELGIIDDRRFAENFAARCNDANISRREALSKMMNKGVPYDLAKEILEEAPVDEEEQIMQVIRKKYERKLNAPNGPERVYAALIRKGFSFSAVRNVLKKYSDELELCEE